MNCEICKFNTLCFREDKEEHNVFDEECQFDSFIQKEGE